MTRLQDSDNTSTEEIPQFCIFQVLPAFYSSLIRSIWNWVNNNHGVSNNHGDFRNVSSEKFQDIVLWCVGVLCKTLDALVFCTLQSSETHTS